MLVVPFHALASEAQFDAVPVGLNVVGMHACDRIAKVDGVIDRQMACDVWEGV